MHYIGMDCHITTLDFAMVNEADRLIKANSVVMGVNGFIEFVKTVPPPRAVYMEESALAAWVLETCVRFGEKLVTTDLKKNRWIGSSGQKDDPLDALKLAQLARGGYIKEIHHSVGQRWRFRELMEAYHDTVRSTTRIKNKIKAKLRENGVQCTGVTVYLETYREEWKGKLPWETTPLLILDGLWRQLEQSEETEKELLALPEPRPNTIPKSSILKLFPGLALLVIYLRRTL